MNTEVNNLVKICSVMSLENNANGGDSHELAGQPTWHMESKQVSTAVAATDIDAEEPTEAAPPCAAGIFRDMAIMYDSVEIATLPEGQEEARSPLVCRHKARCDGFLDRGTYVHIISPGDHVCMYVHTLYCMFPCTIATHLARTRAS